MKSIVLALALLALTACAVCREHPTACTVGLALAGGVLVASQRGHNRTSGVDGRVTTLPVNCTNPGACQ